MWHSVRHFRVSFCFPNIWPIKVSQLRFPCFSDYWKCHRPFGILICDFGSAEVIHKIKKIRAQYTTNTNFGNPRFSSMKMLEKTRTENILSSVLSNLENLEYGINIFQKPCSGHLRFFQFNWRSSNNRMLFLIVNWRNPSHPTPFRFPSLHQRTV